MRTTEARVLLKYEEDYCGFLPEGPRMMQISGRDVLVWVNIQIGAGATTGRLMAVIYDLNWDDYHEACAGRPGFVLPLADGDRVLAGVEKQLIVFNFKNGEWSAPLATIPDDNSRTIINDAEIVPGGKAIVFGTKDTQFKEPIAHLYLYT